MTGSDSPTSEHAMEPGFGQVTERVRSPKTLKRNSRAAYQGRIDGEGSADPAEADSVFGPQANAASVAST